MVVPGGPHSNRVHVNAVRPQGCARERAKLTVLRSRVGDTRNMSNEGAGPQPDDDRVLSIIRDELAPYGEVATIEVSYQQRARMWFTTVQPYVAGAAALEAAFGSNELFLRAGGAQVELFPLGEPVWDIFRQIVAAVLAGDFSEVGNPADAIGRITGPNGTRTFGPARIPYLSRWRRARTYLPYGTRD
jgi:hypothetical protein